jgi:hypothetical protein
MRRAWLAGDGDQNLTWHPLGVLRANDAITEDEYRICCTYARLYGIVLRRAIPPAFSLSGPTGGAPEIDEETLEKKEAKLKRMWAVLDHLAAVHGRAVKEAFDNLVIHQRMPRWMLPVIPRDRDFRDAQLFRLALQAVTKKMTGPAMVKAA